MNANEIAAKLVAIRENTMSGYIMAGQLREELGFEGYGEALRRRWLFADMEGSGMVQITNDMTAIKEMRDLAEGVCSTCHKHGEECKCEKCADCKKAECTCESQLDEKVMSFTTFTKGSDKYHYDENGRHVVGEAPKHRRHEAAPVIAGEPKKSAKPRKFWASESAHFLATAHAHRPHLNEIATLGLGNTEQGAPKDTMAAPSANPQPVAASPQPSSARAQDVNVGTSVKVVQDGKEYVGKIAAVRADGKYAVSFPTAAKPSAARDYDKTELTPIQAAR